MVHGCKMHDAPPSNPRQSYTHARRPYTHSDHTHTRVAVSRVPRVSRALHVYTQPPPDLPTLAASADGASTSSGPSVDEEAVSALMLKDKIIDDYEEVVKVFQAKIKKMDTLMYVPVALQPSFDSVIA